MDDGDASEDKGAHLVEADRHEDLDASCVVGEASYRREMGSAFGDAREVDPAAVLVGGPEEELSEQNQRFVPSRPHRQLASQNLLPFDP